VLRENPVEYGAYLVVSVVLGGVGAALVGSVVGLVAGIALLPAGAVLLVLGALGLRPLLLVLLVPFLLVALAVLLALSAVASVPVITCLRYYALSVLGRTSRYDLHPVRPAVRRVGGDLPITSGSGLAFIPRPGQLPDMSQSTLDDDELFGEAASEMREDVESSLAEARAALPEADAVWEVEADNTLGVLNALRSALDVGDAEDHLRDAKKWYTMGERADAFEDADDLEASIEEVEALMSDIVEAHGTVSDLAATIPELRSALEEAAEDGDDE
jgi:hypothetical protein